MTKKIKNKNHHLITDTPKKKKYVSPSIQVLVIEMEYGIANSSAATVKPTNTTNEVTHTWEVAPDRSTTIEW